MGQTGRTSLQIRGVGVGLSTAATAATALPVRALRLLAAFLLGNSNQIPAQRAGGGLVGLCGRIDQGIVDRRYKHVDIGKSGTHNICLAFRPSTCYEP